jgi:hypothetical protein
MFIALIAYFSISALFLLFLACIMKTQNVRSTLLFKVVPAVMAFIQAVFAIVALGAYSFLSTMQGFFG